MRVLVGCDGGGSLGVGHVIRSLALAEAAVAAGHDVVVAGSFEGSFVRGQLDAAPVEVVRLATPMAGGDCRPFVDLARRVRPDVLHVDSYDAPERLEELLALPDEEAILNDVVLSNVEDGTFGRRPAGVVIDPTLGAERSMRPDDGSTWLLRGSRYAPMRQRVIDARAQTADATGARPRATQYAVDAAGSGAGAVAAVTPVDQHARAVLVVMGGSDPVGLAPAAVDLLARTGLTLEVTVIAVGENAERARAAAVGSALSLKVRAPVDDLAAMMARQDLVISAAGTSVWELCCIGVPMAVLWAVDNQREGYDQVVAAGAALGLGGPELGGPEPGALEVGAHERAVGLLRTALMDSRVRADLGLAGRHVVDGLGAWRVVRMWQQALRLGASTRPGSVKHEPSHRLTSRPAEMSDARLLWEWRNDPATREGSRSPAEVSWGDHIRWLTANLAGTDRMLLVVEDPVGSVGSVGSVGPVGTVRWDLRCTGEWEVSITVAPERRGQSLARPVLRAAEVALSEMASSEVPLSEAASSEVASSEVARSSGSRVTAYLAVVHVDNRASVRLFETSGYVPDLPPDPRGFMRYRKVARVT